FNQPLTTAPGSVLKLTGNLTVTGDLANYGVLELRNKQAGASSTLTVSGKLTNAPGGLILASPGFSGGVRSIVAPLDNQGTVTANHTLLISATSGAVTNSGLIQAVGGDLTVNEMFTNNGTVSVAGGQTFTVGAPFTNFDAGMLAGGTYHIAGT